MKNSYRKKGALLMTCALLFAPVFQSCDTNPTGELDSDQWVVTLDYDDGVSRPGTLYVDKGESVDLPDDPKRDGYAFIGWADSQGNLVDGDAYTPTANVTLTAKWEVGTCTVTFRANYEGGEDITQEVAYGSYITEAPTMTRTDYTFRYWSVLPDGGEADFATYPIQGDYEFYAIWMDAGTQEFTITVTAGEYEGAPEDSTITVLEGESIRESNRAFRNVDRDGYELEGWTEVVPEDGKTWTIDDYDNIDDLLPELIEFPYTPTASLTLYAVWSIQQYSVIWNANYTDSPYSNGVISVDTVLSNEAVVPPETNPTRENYTFTGWYASALGNTKIEFDDNTRIKANTGYYAHWKHDLVETDTFQAEYVYFDPNKQYWGYSGGVVGHKCIVKDPGTAGTVMVDDYPLNSVLTDHYGFYVSYQYEKGCTLRFEIESSAATSATLLGNFAMEGQNGAPNVTSVSNTGDYATQITVNGTPLTYTLNFSDTAFHEMEVGTVQLKEGLNVIEIIVDNSNNVAGGTYKATGFNTDYIKLDGASSTLSWSPIYDNLEEVF